MRIALGVEYDGSGFCGWQFQAHGRSIQGELQRALSSVADHEVKLTAAGRTDAGVHALMQVAHFDTAAQRPERSWVLGANSNCPPDLSVLWAREVPEQFHARHSAVARRYLYRIADRPIRPALDRQRVCWCRARLDERAMHDAAQVLLGEHDFSAFRAAECQSRSPVRRVLEVGVRRVDEFVAISIEANAFLHHMVRNIVGALLAVGAGERDRAWIAELLESRDRTRGGVTAPPQGLYFVAPSYPAAFGLPDGTEDLAPAGACLGGGGRR
ncbi:MAG TPA: tRNA pseudouridine(38-40) synthase TruA [Steroidobacteraceae bacterium]|nr:tRNA pseudouridine(38-40) synthase TruA [Steroidobacteraceae bacterium]